MIRRLFRENLRALKPYLKNRSKGARIGKGTRGSSRNNDPKVKVKQQVVNVSRDREHEILKIYSTICKHEDN